MLMPSHAKNVKLYTDTQPLLSRYGVENQLDAMFSPVVQLRSGGYIVINQAEALVAIDVNSGRATREHHIEDTALKTNLEAADEIARQLRLRDLAGLIVIDFIDMDEKRNNRSVERRLKECLKQDRARIQVGRISHFGLLEMSRQRIRASVLESSTEKCPYCGGSGHVRSVSSLALQVLRALEEQLMRGATHNLIARTRPDVALYVLNQKRAHLRALEERFAITLTISSDDSVRGPQAFIIERGEQVHTPEAARAIAEQAPPLLAVPLEEEDDLEEAALPEGEEAEEAGTEAAAPERDGGPRRRRRRRRGRGRDSDREIDDGIESPMHAQTPTQDALGEPEDDESAESEDGLSEGEDTIAGEQQSGDRESRADSQGDHRRRRRGRRGGRRNRRDREHNGYDASHEGNEHGPQAPQHEFASDQAQWPAQTEAEPLEPRSDFGGHPMEAEPPSAESGAAPASMHVEVTPQPAPALAHEPDSSEPPAPRHRSTVREAAPASGGTDTAASSSAPPVSPAEPVITEIDEGESAKRPRRTGWWSRRSADG
jgi:ribonuclease E